MRIKFHFHSNGFARKQRPEETPVVIYIYIFHDYMSYLTVNCRSKKVLFFNPGLCRLKLLDPFFASHLGIKETNQIHILPHQKKNKKSTKSGSLARDKSY